MRNKTYGVDTCHGCSNLSHRRGGCRRGKELMPLNTIVTANGYTVYIKPPECPFPEKQKTRR